MKRRFWILVFILMILVLISGSTGRYSLSLTDIFSILIGKSQNEMDKNLFYQIRLSRTFSALFAGAALSLAGQTYQTVFQNPLVSPDVLGVSSGCSIGAVLAILWGSSFLTGAWLLTFCCGILTVFLSLLLAAAMGGNRRYTMLLSGIIIGALANSVIMTLKYTADPTRELPSIEYWLMGSFQNASWKSLNAVLPVMTSASLILYLLRWRIKILTMGDEEAQSLGIRVQAVRITALICATILVAAVVSTAGSVSWIGLIAPHIVRRMAGEDYAGHFFPTLLMGAILLLLADLFARSIFSAEIPISILTSFFGAVLLGIILWKKRYENRE